MTKLKKEFYTRDAVTVAQELLGKYIVRKTNGHTLTAMITETEAYKACDRACHAYNYNRTKRNAVMFGEGGCAYVYFIYGMYNCLNVVTDREGEPSAVLIRGAVPCEDSEYMSFMRYKKSFSELSSYQKKNFSNGPGKLCIALDIDRSLNGEDLTGGRLYIAEGREIKSFNTGKRIGIDYAGEAKDYLWRFYL